MTPGPLHHRTGTTMLPTTSTHSKTLNHSSQTTIEFQNILQSQNVLSPLSQSEELKSGLNRSLLLLHRWLLQQQLYRHDSTLATTHPRHLPMLLSVTRPTDVVTIPMSQTTKDERCLIGSDISIVRVSCVKIEENKKHCIIREAVYNKL